MGYNELEYANAVGRIRALENKLLDRMTFEKLISSKSLEEAKKTLSDLGYAHDEDFNAALDKELKKTYEFLESLGAEPVLMPLKVKYDYHNIKVLLKSELTGEEPESLLMDFGNMKISKLKDGFINRTFKDYTQNMKDGIVEATERYAKNPDVQLTDIILDSKLIKDMMDYANRQPDDFFKELMKMQLDMYNIKTYLRVISMGKDFSFMDKVIFEGGQISKSFYMANATALPDKARSIFETGLYAKALSEEQDVELSLDNLFMQKAAVSKRKAFGLSPLVFYFFEKEREIRNVRIILTCLSSNIEADLIKKRLRS